MFNHRDAIASAMGFLLIAFVLFLAFPKPAFSQCVTAAAITKELKRLAIEQDWTLKVYYQTHDGDVIKEAVYVWRKNKGVRGAYFGPNKCLIRMLQMQSGAQTDLTLSKAHLIYERLGEAI